MGALVTPDLLRRPTRVRRALAHLSSPGAFSSRRAGWLLTVTRCASGAVFLIFGAGKFVNHASEVSSFQTYGLPWPNLFTDAIGVLELAGGLLLAVGLATRLVAVLLAGDMVGAVIVSGLMRGETISLTLAPALLVATCVLVVFGSGRLALDAELFARSSRDRRSTAGLAPSPSDR
jgi:putative oxidoreductase